MIDQSSLRQRIARAVHRYDYDRMLSGNNMPSKHHYGEADFVLAELRAELAAPAAVVSVPAADRAALRDRIAEALIRWTYRGQDPDPETGILDTVRANAYSRADAVLSVLPAPADRATEWRAAADKLDGISAQFDVDSCDCGNCTLCAWKDAARHLRRLAAAAGRVAADTPPADTCGQTRDISGNEHPPCARQTDHSEAYCRSADGNAYFLATGQPGKDTGTPGEA